MRFVRHRSEDIHTPPGWIKLELACRHPHLNLPPGKVNDKYGASYNSNYCREGIKKAVVRWLTCFYFVR